MFKYSKLSGRIKEKCGSQANFANMIGLSERTICLKMNNKVEWKQGEIIKACNILDIADEDIPSYFFVA